MNQAKKRVLILTTKTGGGHRSCADAVKEVLESKYSDSLEITDVNFFEEYFSRPLGNMPEIYPRWVQIPKAWEAFYKLTATKKRARLVVEKLGKLYTKDIRTLLESNPCDTIVSFHFGVNAFFDEIQKIEDPPEVIEVVTDLVAPHPSWFDDRNTKTFVPTPQAAQFAKDFGISASKLEVSGLPISSKFSRPLSKTAARKQLGLPDNNPIVLVMAGGDGMGKVRSMVTKLDTVHQNFTLVVVAGRNKRLKKSLEKNAWAHPIRIYGFTDKIPELMAASDILFTKAGPSTICEAISAKTPIVIYDFLPGQEEPNVDFVTTNKLGLRSDNHKQACAALTTLLTNPDELTMYAKNCEKFLFTKSAATIADYIAHSE